MKRLAYLSPLPPEPSGIADYSQELLPALARHTEIDLYTSHPARLDPILRENFRTFPYSAFLKARHHPSYDLALYQLGNNVVYHREIYHALHRHRGIVVLHEYVLQHLIRGLTLKRQSTEYVEEMRYAYGSTGMALARRLVETGAPVDPWTYPLFERVVDSSHGIIVHSRTARQRILASRPRARVAVVPHHLSLGAVNDPPSASPSSRSRLGMGEETFVVASYGLATPSKRLEVGLRGFARLRRHHPDSAFLLVGEIAPGSSEIESLLSGELGEGVLATGRVPIQSFLDLMTVADVALNLRHPTGGETSGSCLRLLGLGKPVVVNRSGWFAEIPADCCVHIDRGVDEEEVLEGLLLALARNRDLGRRIGQNARAWVRESHHLDRSAQAYADFVEEVLANPTAPNPPVPPLAPYPDEDLATALVAEVSAAAADLGLGEEDADELEVLAETLVDLDLDLTGR